MVKGEFFLSGKTEACLYDDENCPEERKKWMIEKEEIFSGEYTGTTKGVGIQCISEGLVLERGTIYPF